MMSFISEKTLAGLLADLDLADHLVLGFYREL